MSDNNITLIFGRIQQMIYLFHYYDMKYGQIAKLELKALKTYTADYLTNTQKYDMLNDILKELVHLHLEYFSKQYNISPIPQKTKTVPFP